MWSLRLAHKEGCSLCKYHGMPALGAFSHPVRSLAILSPPCGKRIYRDSRERKRKRQRVQELQLFQLSAVLSLPNTGATVKKSLKPRPGRPLYNCTCLRDPNWEQLLSSTQSTPRILSKIISIMLSQCLGWSVMQQWIFWTILICAKPPWPGQLSHTQGMGTWLIQLETIR